MDANRSEFGEEPIIITFLSLGRLCSSILAIKLFHIEHDSKTKLFLEISNVTTGRYSKKLMSLSLSLSKEYKDTGL